MERLVKVAMPPTALTVAVPLKVPPPGFVPIAIVTLAVLEATRLLLTSKTRTVTAGAMLWPAAVFVGCWPNAKWYLVKVAVTDWALLPIERLQELPEQPVMPADCALHPMKVDVESAVAVSFPTSMFPTETLQGFGVPVQVVLFDGVVVSESATEPPPVPAKAIAMFFAAATYGPTKGP